MSLNLNSPEGLAFDNSGNLWVANYNANTVVAFNTKTWGQVNALNPAAALNGPSRLAYDAKTDELFVTNSKGNTVAKYDLAAALTPKVWPGFQRPLGVAVNPQTGNFYVANNAANNLQVLNAAGTVLNTITMDNKDFRFTAPGALASNGADLYVGLGPGAGQNAVISYQLPVPPATEITVYTNPVNTGPTGITFDNAGNVYVSDLYSGTWVKYSQAGVLLQAPTPSGYPEGIAWEASTGYVYVSNAQANSINVFTSTGTFVKTMS